MIIDTNALTAIADHQPGIDAALEQAREAAIPVIVLGEYGFGIAQSARQSRHERWLKESLPLFRVLHITEETAGYYAGLSLELRRAGTPIPSNDLWIAALCRQHDFPVLSKDRHFDRVKGLRRVEW